VSRTDNKTAFYFGESNLTLRPERVEVRIPAGISMKRDLLAKLDAGLSFPDYFGGNWDALWECICDLAWLHPAQVVVMHEDLPLKHDPGQLQTYLSILNDAIAYWDSRSEHELIVVFPKKFKAQVSMLMASRESS